MSIYQDHLTKRQTQETQATELLVALAKLSTQNVNILFFGERVALSVSDILAKHAKAGLDVADTLALAKEITATNTTADLDKRSKQVKKQATLPMAPKSPPRTWCCMAFGRIGRILARLLMSRPASDKGLQLKAIVVRPAGDGDLDKRGSLLERDSVHGWFDGSVEIDKRQ